MAEMMRAFVMKGIGEVAFAEKPRPTDPGPNGAIVKTTRGLVCTSDTHTVKGAIGDRENLTLGHEAVGIVDRLGSEVKSFKEGDRVAVIAHSFAAQFSSQTKHLECPAIRRHLLGVDVQ